MTTETIERCDCCRTQVPRLGSRGDDEGSIRAVYSRTRWQFNPSRLGWGIIGKDKQAICGRCWNAIGEAVRNGGPK
jgi:hypothetical protein